MTVFKDGFPQVPQTKAQRRPDLLNRETCNYGHKWSENAMPRKDGGRYCRACNSEKKRKQRANHQKNPVAKVEPETCRFGHLRVDFWDYKNRKCSECKRIYTAHNKSRTSSGLPPIPLVVIMGDYATEGIIMAKKNSLDSFKLTPTQAVVSDEFAYAVADSAEAGTNLRPKCEDNPGPYMDYKENNEPSIVDAMKLCAGCPFIESCQKLAEELKPVAGVWGPGVVWLNGKPRE